jgi:hypothetical protein
MDHADPHVSHAIGDAYATGRGVPSDRLKALGWLRRAAQADIVEAMVSFHSCAAWSDNRAALAEGILWLRRGAELGFAGAMVWLGFACREGRGVEADYDLAVGWFSKAVKAGDVKALMHVGRMYAEYMDRHDEAVKAFLRASEEGITASHTCLAWLYANPESPVFSAVDAHYWYERVMEEGGRSAARAMLGLARLHLSGRGLPVNLPLARQWLKRLMDAVSEDSPFHSQAAKLLSELADSML